MSTHREHHTDYSYPFILRSTNACEHVKCTVKYHLTRVATNKPVRWWHVNVTTSTQLTASNRVVGACHYKTNTDLTTLWCYPGVDRRFLAEKSSIELLFSYSMQPPPVPPTVTHLWHTHCDVLHISTSSTTPVTHFNSLYACRKTSLLHSDI